MAGNGHSGRRAVPLKVLELEGKDPRRPRNVVDIPAGRPQKPEDLDCVASEHWDFVCRVRPDWVDVADAASLQRMCEAWSGAQAAWSAMQSADSVLCQKMQAIYLAYVRQWQSLAGLFGLTPADRARYVTEAKQTDREKSEQYLA